MKFNNVAQDSPGLGDSRFGGGEAYLCSLFGRLLAVLASLLISCSRFLLDCRKSSVSLSLSADRFKFDIPSLLSVRLHSLIFDLCVPLVQRLDLPPIYRIPSYYI